MEKNETYFTGGYALLIGVGNYLYINPLPVTVHDAEILHTILTDPERAGYPGAHVKLLVNEDASKAGIIAGLDWLIECAEKDPDATILIYYSGHGGTKESQYMLLPYDFDWKKWKDLGISKDEFAKKTEAINAKKLMVFLDCCHAAGIATKASVEHEFRPSNQALYDELQKGKGKVVVASSRHDQYSHILRNAKYSVFTDALLEALDGKADDGESYASVLRTLTYISENLAKETRAMQTPVFNMYNLEDFSICRINSPLAKQQPFKKTAAYLGHGHYAETVTEISTADLHSFVKDLLALLDEYGFAAVPRVLDNIKDAGFEYNKPAFANIRNDGTSNLAMFMPNDYITRLKIFIGTLSIKKNA